MKKIFSGIGEPAKVWIYLGLFLFFVIGGVKIAMYNWLIGIAYYVFGGALVFLIKIFLFDEWDDLKLTAQMLNGMIDSYKKRKNGTN